MPSLLRSWPRLGAFLSVLLLATAAHAAPLQVVTTTTMVTDLVSHVGGNRVSITGLMGAGVDPHLYKPTAADVTRLQRAQVIFFSGLHLEGRMAELFERLGKGGKKVHAVTSSIPEARLLRPAEFEGQFDPHVWGDAELWALCIDSVVKGLSAADPAGKADFEQRGEAYKAELVKLHQWAIKRAGTLPEKQRILITSHDAFNYLGRAYGFKVVGVQGISTVTEAGLADIAKVVDFIKTNGIKAIFVESSVPRAAIERISKDSGAKIGGELFSDAMGAAGTKVTVQGETYDEGTYDGMLRHNINTVVEALK
ncbi:MAG: zinc ABC transporter substrate-binding protein [Verrucomicrobiota bacterium]